MSAQQIFSVGSPVDAWWNDTRIHLIDCINMLAQPVQDNHEITQALHTVSAAYRYVRNTAFPYQADEIRGYLLASLTCLIESLHEQQAADMYASKVAHDMAVQKYLLMIYLLLERGIYEPVPKDQKLVFVK